MKQWHDRVSLGIDCRGLPSLPTICLHACARARCSRYTLSVVLVRLLCPQAFNSPQMRGGASIEDPQSQRRTSYTRNPLLHHHTTNQPQDQARRMNIHQAAATAGELALARLEHLIEQDGVSPNARGSEGNTPLLAAARAGNVAALTCLLTTHGVDIEQKDDSGHTAFFLACNYGRDAAARMLLSKGADPCMLDQHGDSPLMVASYWGHEATVRLLLANGRCGLEHRHHFDGQYQGHTALLDAVEDGHWSIAEMLLEAGASPLATDREGRDALQLAHASNPLNPPPASFVAAFHRQRAEPQRAAHLRKLRYIFDVAHACTVAAAGAATATVPGPLQGRVRTDQPLPDARVTTSFVAGGEKLRGVVMHVLGGNGAGPGQGLSPDLFKEVVAGFMLPKWVAGGEDLIEEEEQGAN